MCGIDQKAGPDAVTNARIHRRCDLNLVNGATAASAQGPCDAFLPLKKSVQDEFDLPAFGGFQVKNSFLTGSGRRLKNPGQQTSPKIGAIGRIHFGFARGGIGNDLLPDGEVGICTDVEMLKAFGRRPGARGRRLPAQFFSA